MRGQADARGGSSIDAARGIGDKMGDRLSRVFVLHDTPKFVALGVEYAIAEGARPSLPSTRVQVVIHARHSFSRAVRDTSCLQSAHPNGMG